MTWQLRQVTLLIIYLNCQFLQYLHFHATKNQSIPNSRNSLQLKPITYPLCILIVREAGDAQHLGCLEEGGEAPLVHVHLAVVDELHQRVQVRERHVLQDYHGVLAWRRLLGEGTFEND